MRKPEVFCGELRTVMHRTCQKSIRSQTEYLNYPLEKVERIHLRAKLGQSICALGVVEAMASSGVAVATTPPAAIYLIVQL